MNSSALRWENSSSKRITTISSTPSPSSTSRFTSSELISFGACSGCSTSSGCGSKVSTVSAPSITARWPRWTPSKVPIATSRARGLDLLERSDLDRHQRTFSSQRVARPPGPARRPRRPAPRARPPRPGTGRPRRGAGRSSRRRRASRSASARRCRRCTRSRSGRSRRRSTRRSARCTSTSRTGVSTVSPRWAFL